MGEKSSCLDGCLEPFGDRLRGFGKPCTGGWNRRGNGQEAPIRAESTMDTVHSVQEEAAAPTDREGNAHPAESGGNRRKGFWLWRTLLSRKKFRQPP